MTLPHILLVTGSRALADTDAAAAWANDAIETAIFACGPTTVVVAGDARGPDAWAIEAATFRDLRWTRFGLDGWYEMSTGERRLWASIDERETTPRKVWPLRRNKVMVARVAAAVASKRYTASALALRAPWAKTNGTAHTTTLCTRAGITTAAHVCPGEFGPKRVG